MLSDTKPNAETRREVWVEASYTAQSKEGLIRPLRNLQTHQAMKKSICPRNSFILESLLCCHRLEAALGEHDMGTRMAMDFRAEELEILVIYIPWSIMLPQNWKTAMCLHEIPKNNSQLSHL